MTEKRFENRLNKSDIKFNTLNPVWDNEKETALNVFEMIEEMNKLEGEKIHFKNGRSSWKITASEEICKHGETIKKLAKVKEENEQLKQCIDIMGGRLQGLWAHYYANRWGIWSEVAEDIANELGFKIHHAYDDPIPNSESKKERIEGVKKITEILGENELIKQENKELKEKIEKLQRFEHTGSI